MTSLRMITITTVLLAGLQACAQTPMADSMRPPGAAASAPSAQMAAMDNHMKAMREMHDKLGRARTPEERQALMAEHMKLMHEGMSMMGGMGPGAMGHGGMGMGGMGGMGMGGTQGSPQAMAERMQMMEKHMEMMQSMMQMMMDRMGPPAAARP